MTSKRRRCSNLYEPVSVSSEGFRIENAASVAIENCLNDGVHPMTMPAMKTTIDALESAGVRTQVKVLIGCAPVTSQYAKEIGADGYSENASGAVSQVKSLLAKA